MKKILTSEKPDSKIDWDIVESFSKIIKISKIIESNDNEFEAIVDTFFINVHDFDKILEVSKEIYGENCGFHFNAENKWNISFGVMRRSCIKNGNN